jgi:hypothetical protein
MPKGYGKLTFQGRAIYAHRLAYELTIGPIPDGMLVCHHCDNPPCCRPDHLFLGDQKANLADMVAKRRWPSPPRTFRILSPDGQLIEGVNLSAFCAAHGLHRAHFKQVLLGTRPHHFGWRRA